MDLSSAINVIESVAGFTDTDTAVGEAWVVVMAQLKAAPVPVAVSERLPEAGDCDAEGQIWAWYCDDPDVEYEGNFWTPLYLRLVTASHNVTHWLPASAMPIPQHPQPDPTA